MIIASLPILDQWTGYPAENETQWPQMYYIRTDDLLDTIKIQFKSAEYISFLSHMKHHDFNWSDLKISHIVYEDGEIILSIFLN